MTQPRQLGGRLLLAGVILALALGVSGCRRHKRGAAPRPPAPPLAGEPAAGEAEVGLASWYGKPYHGRPTANGEIYDMNVMTAAHRTLAFNTLVRVVNLENQRLTTVRINDRGPFIEGRIIDLSRAAAEAIDMVGPGTALVRLEILPGPGSDPAAPAQYAVQVGAFKVEENARRLQAELKERFKDVFVQEHDAPDGLYYRVRVGRKATLREAGRLAEQLRRLPDIVATFVVRLN